jgi:hypothetical protein
MNIWIEDIKMKKIKHIPKHKKLARKRSLKYTRILAMNLLMRQGYTMPDKYLGGS